MATYGAQDLPLMDQIDADRRLAGQPMTRGYPITDEGMFEDAAPDAVRKPGQKGYDPRDQIAESRHLSDADAALKLSPEERSLYERHLDNLGDVKKRVDNPDKTISTLSALTIGIDGRTYVIPTVRDGRRLSDDDAVAAAEREGFDKFPSYSTLDEAKKRYDDLHGYMERDTEDHQSLHPIADHGSDPYPRGTVRIIGGRPYISDGHIDDQSPEDLQKPPTLLRDKHFWVPAPADSPTSSSGTGDVHLAQSEGMSPQEIEASKPSELKQLKREGRAPKGIPDDYRGYPGLPFGVEPGDRWPVEPGKRKEINGKTYERISPAWEDRTFDWPFTQDRPSADQTINGKPIPHEERTKEGVEYWIPVQPERPTSSLGGDPNLQLARKGDTRRANIGGTGEADYESIGSEPQPQEPHQRPAGDPERIDPGEWQDMSRELREYNNLPFNERGPAPSFKSSPNFDNSFPHKPGDDPMDRYEIWRLKQRPMSLMDSADPNVRKVNEEGDRLARLAPVGTIMTAKELGVLDVAPNAPPDARYEKTDELWTDSPGLRERRAREDLDATDRGEPQPNWHDWHNWWRLVPERPMSDAGSDPNVKLAASKEDEAAQAAPVGSVMTGEQLGMDNKLARGEEYVKGKPYEGYSSEEINRMIEENIHEVDAGRAPTTWHDNKNFWLLKRERPMS